jgi:hypothetical protein
MPNRSNVSGVLRVADLETGDLVVVVSTAVVSSGLNGMKIRSGEVLQCIDRSESGTIVARADGSRILVDKSDGRLVDVRHFWDMTPRRLSEGEKERAS